MSTTSFEDLQRAWDSQHQRLTQLQGRFDRAELHRALEPGPWTIAFSMACIGLLAAYCAQQWGQWRYLLPGAALLLWCVLTLAGALQERQRLAKVDFAQPVAILQLALVEAKLRRLHQLRWAFVTGHVLWCVPFAVVLARGLFGATLLEGEMLSTLAWATFWTAVPIPFEFALMRWAGRQFNGRAAWTQVTDALAGNDIVALRRLLRQLRE
jgi:hypothetical protein